ncbi:MAG: Lrp/AsnC family transcriptional regulator [Bacteroidia bacterium]|nr:Lrp/AsnC family transcriptional regulator [Bacteroidia bacterium]NND26660.1 Lrp/AsnC family transcriptional regulator [Flavobacteriaceae bacterium]MBT8279881.1 Lrp/AsnC family transcriptional regulator [Bacteroidia bacterium]NNK60695.1 Lrp/AsnC family transcriptional regulator [Flavobacteriaceae bacterium]NNL33947.1 Lrp/AsnC family transcriptional regulator [Flavobacteriaceae bacterium]
MNLDSTDKNIIMRLQEDCKQTNKELSNALGLSVTAIYERVKKLEKEQIIQKYVAVIDKDKIDKGFVAFCHIKLEKHAKDFVVKFEKEVCKLDEVLECYHISGDYDYILKILVKDMAAYRDFMVKKLTTIDHIGSTHSTFMISEVKQSSQIKF